MDTLSFLTIFIGFQAYTIAVFQLGIGFGGKENNRSTLEK